MPQVHYTRDDDDLTDLGAASDLTHGFWDPMMFENHLTPEARDF